MQFKGQRANHHDKRDKRRFPLPPLSTFLPVMSESIKHTQSVILVTGGSGLVGSAIQHVIETEPIGSKFGRREDEKWVFVTSKDGDLRCVSSSTWKCTSLT